MRAIGTCSVGASEVTRHSPHFDSSPRRIHVTSPIINYTSAIFQHCLVRILLYGTRPLAQYHILKSSQDGNLEAMGNGED